MQFKKALIVIGLAVLQEFIIEFQGLHLQRPDLTIINWTAPGELQTSGSLRNYLSQDGGLEVLLNKETIPSIISFVDAKDENDPTVEYQYKNQQLVIQRRLSLN